MKSIRYEVLTGGWIIILLLLTFSVVGCANTAAHTRFQVIPLSNQNAADLSTEDIIQVMQRAGFSNEQILELGPDLRDGLSTSGAAQVKVGDKVEVIFAVHSDCVYISTRLRGNFIYNMKGGWVGNPSPRS
jgi:hypothetical protein